MIIGVPTEIMRGEDRVSASPETVAKMVADGHKVLVEKGAGVGSFFIDEEYEKAGATIVADVKELFEKADVILKVKEPQFNEKLKTHEVDLMHKGQYLITFIHPASPVNHTMVKNLTAKGVTALTLDGIPRISRAQNMDALSSMSTCAGYKGMLLAANAVSRFIPMIGSAVGMIKPCKVLVLGVGVAGLRAIATAKGLGAIVHAADIRKDAVEQAMSLGAKIVPLDIPNEIAVSPDGKHANALPEKWLEVERENLKAAVAESDIIFCSALVFGEVAPILINDEMLKSMKPGSVIVDISIDQGGNCSKTPAGSTEVIDHVTIIGIKNIPGLLPTSSTWMFAQNIYNFLKYIVKDGSIELDHSDEIVSSTLVCENGVLIHAGAKHAMGIS